MLKQGHVNVIATQHSLSLRQVKQLPYVFSTVMVSINSRLLHLQVVCLQHVS